MILLDSNVIIACNNKRDALHQQALKVDVKSAAINQLVFSEIANVLQKRVQDKAIVMNSLREVLEEMTILTVTDDDLIETLDIFSENYPKLSFTDSSLLALSKRHGIEVVSFDSELNKRKYLYK